LDRAGRVRGRVRVGRWACRVAVDERGAWVTRDNGDELVRVDRRPTKGASARLRRIAVDSPFDLVLAAGSVWVTSFESGTLTRLDAANGRELRSFDIGGSPAGIALCAGRVWVGHGRDATWLTAVDPATGRARRVGVGARGPGWPRCARGELWVATQDSVLRVDPRSGEVRARVRLGGTPAEATAVQDGIGFWTIWVTDKERSLVNRIDPVTNRVLDTFPAGPGAYSLARFAGSTWIASFAGSDVRRYDP
jgi:streptogramin lyase